jgi:hypothetical protein
LIGKLGDDLLGGHIPERGASGRSDVLLSFVWAEFIGRWMLGTVAFVLCGAGAPADECACGKPEAGRGLLQPRPVCDRRINERKDHLAFFPLMFSSASPQISWTFFFKYQQGRGFSQGHVLAPQLLFEDANAFYIAGMTLGLFSRRFQLQPFDHLLAPALEVGFVQPLMAQKDPELFIVEALGFQHGLKFFFGGPFFGSARLHGVHLDGSMGVVWENIRSLRPSLPQPFGKRRLRDIDLFGEGRGRDRFGAAHALHHFSFEHVRIGHVKLLAAPRNGEGLRRVKSPRKGAPPPGAS